MLLYSVTIIIINYKCAALIAAFYLITVKGENVKKKKQEQL